MAAKKAPTNSGSSRRAELRAAQEREAAKARKIRVAIIAIVAVIVLAIIVAVVLATTKKSGSSNSTPTSPVSVGTTPPNASTGNKGIYSSISTSTTAPVLTVVEDFQCPACHQYENLYGPIFESLAQKGQIRLEYRTRHFLDQNFASTTKNPNSSALAAQGAACADTVGNFQQYHDVVFKNQPTQEGTGYTAQQLRSDFPQAAGITDSALSTFQSCYDNKTMQSFVDFVDQQAGTDGYNSTPTFLVNNKEIKFTNYTNPDANYVMSVVKAA